MTTSRRSFVGLAAGAWLAARVRAQTPSDAVRPGGADSVLVVGGTGRVGAIAVRRLASAGIRVAFTTRSERSVGMFGPGAEGVVADLNRRSGLERLFAGYAAVFMIIANSDEETTQGVNCVSAMRQGGVKRVVYLSVARSIPHYDVTGNSAASFRF